MSDASCLMGLRGFGCIPDRLADAERDARTRHVAGLVGGVPSYPEDVDLSHHLDRVPDQGRTNSCVGWYVSTAVYIAGQTSGRPVPRPSPKWNYDVARYADTPGILLDIGSRCSQMLDGLGRHGMISEARLPLSDANVNDAPPFDADIGAADAVLTGYYKLEGNVPVLMRMALAAGHVPGFAIVVHESFHDLSGPEVYDEPDGMELGRHMLTAVGYRPGAIRVLNSWGTTWGDGGLCWMSDRFLASHYVFDRYVVTSAPPIS